MKEDAGKQNMNRREGAPTFGDIFRLIGLLLDFLMSFASLLFKALLLVGIFVLVVWIIF